jgi:2-polyprenyl-3-methyl-5-hydroxy-6-metoxy-1,4-benzoquinol methylase
VTTSLYHLNERESANNPHSLLVRYANGGRLVLDVGCATGYLASKLAATGAVVDGIEVDRSAAAEALAVCRHVVVGSAADADVWRQTQGSYDVVVLGDVIEHLPDPVGALGLAKGVLALGGRLVVSLPNVANWLVRARLVAGRFEYSDTGIMDRTHLRWFTLRTCHETFAAAGLTVARWAPAAGGPTPVALLKLRPQLFAPQFVFDLRPTP